MAFLASFEDYPTTGYELSRAAKREDCSDKLVHFLEHLPGEIGSEQEVVRFALEEAGLDVDMVSGRRAERREDKEGGKIGQLDMEAVKKAGGG